MGIEAGGDDYLTKPINPIILQAKLDAIQRIAATYRSLDETNQKLARLSTEDSLTGIANRRRFDEVLEREWRRMRRASNSLALVMIDVDFFKSYNDNYGHQAGDGVLKKVAALFSKHLKRPGDIVARYGGEEFAMILPDTQLRGAVHIAEHMRKAVEKLKIEHSYSQAASFLTISAGIAAVVPYKNGLGDLIKKADENLYLAKQQGRNRLHADSIDYKL
jgi:diguanylate cyclase (GGDEF)-like protein